MLFEQAGEKHVSRQGPKLGEPIDMPRLLALGVQLKPDDTALISAEGCWSWCELERASERYAANLLDFGLRPSDRVASLMPNCDAVLIHYLGCFKSGIVATPLNYRYTPPEIDHALRTSGAAALLAHAERDTDIASSRLVRQLSLGVIDYGTKGGRRPSFEALLESTAQHGELPVPAPTDPAAIFFTSGSTGPAKGVTHSFETLGWIIASVVHGCGITADDIILSGSSLSHIGAFTDTFMGLAAGARVIVPRSSGGREIIQLLREHRPTIFIMLPASLFALVREHDATQKDFASIRSCMSGGDKVPIELGREFAALTGFPINEGYGMTEIGIATINPLDGLIKTGSVGRAHAAYQVSIRDEDGTELPTDVEGRLWIKSPCNMIGYWGDPQATRAIIKNGWLDTGDVMKLDEDGYLWFGGRQKQIIVHDGSNISPQEVEDALLQHPALASAGVVGVRDLVHGENVQAFVTLRPGTTPPAPHELIDFARARVGYKAPENIFVLEEMPLNTTGKVDREALKKMAEELSRDSMG